MAAGITYTYPSVATIQAQLDAGRNFKVSVRMATGQTNLDYHGFALTLDRELNLWLLEPNAGFPFAGKWFKQGENSYTADRVFV